MQAILTPERKNTPPAEARGVSGRKDTSMKVIRPGDEYSHPCKLPDLNWGGMLPDEFKGLYHGAVVECDCGAQYRWHQSIGWLPVAERV